MDWSKVDPALAGALSEPAGGADAPLSVFVHLDPEEAEEAGGRALERFGLDPDPGAGRTRTASLTPAAVRRLTEQRWVRRIQLSAPLDLFGEG